MNDRPMIPRAIIWIALIVFARECHADELGVTKRDLFAPIPLHNHSSCVVECPNGDLLATWYRGSGERRSDDVQILGARLKKGSESWSEPFLMADTPGYPDCNPILFASPEGNALWLFYPTILDHRWEGALLKYAVADDFEGDGPIQWKKEGVFHITPKGFVEDVEKALANVDTTKIPLPQRLIDEARELAGQEIYQRLGWMPRCHFTVLRDGRWLFPLYTDTFSAGLVAYSDDQGRNWEVGHPIFGLGNIQPSLVERHDGSIVAYMRDNSGSRRVAVATSSDRGVNWSEVTRTEIPHPGSSVEALRLKDGRWLLTWNDQTDGRHTLAVAMSEDEGKTWPHKRLLEAAETGTQSFHYPSIIQTSDGLIQVTYTNGGREGGSTIRHATFAPDWVKGKD
jgi:predicted neuraminidase